MNQGLFLTRRQKDLITLVLKKEINSLRGADIFLNVEDEVEELEEILEELE